MDVFKITATNGARRIVTAESTSKAVEMFEEATGCEVMLVKCITTPQVIECSPADPFEDAKIIVGMLETYDLVHQRRRSASGDAITFTVYPKEGSNIQQIAQLIEEFGERNDIMIVGLDVEDSYIWFQVPALEIMED